MNLHNSKTYISDLDIAIKQSIGLEKLKERKVLITGATGTIGSFITDMLLRYNQTANAGIMTYVAGRNVKKLRNMYRGEWYADSLQYDLNFPPEFDICVDYIIHAAGNAHPAAFNGDPVGTITGNVIGTYNLLEFAKKHKAKRFLYVSSGEVYGQSNMNLDEVDENYVGHLDILSSRSCYPLSKRISENLCACYSRQYGLDTIIVRPCHTYGPNITETDNRASTQFIRNVLCGEDVVMKSDGRQMRSYNYIADCASAVLTVLINGKSEEAYNIANYNTRITIVELAKIIAETAQKKVIFLAPDEGDIANRTPIMKQVLSSKKLEAFGWTGAFSIQMGIEHTLKILQED